MRPRSKPIVYNPLPFHAVRLISFISALIVASILGFFCRQLWSDGYKIPWTFIIVFIAAIATIAAMVLTSIISCCTTLSPILNILINILVLIAWIVGTSLLTWNMYGALGHSCSITNWGNDRGVMVCQIYKTLYSFIIFAGLAQIAQIVLDVRARRRQVRRGKYDKMEDSQDIKVDDLKPLAPHTIHDTPLASETSLQTQYRDDYQRNLQEQDVADEMPGWRPGQRQPMNRSDSYLSGSTAYSGRHNDPYHVYDNSSSVQLQDLSYQQPQPTTHYDSRDYHHGGYGYQQNTHYQERY